MKICSANDCYIGFLLLLTGSLAFYSLDKMSFHGDESYWITEGIQAFKLAKEGDVLNPFWNQRPMYYLITPPMAKVFIGAALYLFRIEHGSWEFFSPHGVTGQVPPDNVLLAARVPSAIAGTLTILAMVLVGRKLEREQTGYTSALFLAFSTLFLLSARRAMCDIYALMFSTWALFIFISYINCEKPSRLLLCGILSGLATNSKYTAVLIPLTLALLLFLGRFGSSSHSTKKSRIAIAKGMIVLGISTAVAMISNPFFYLNTLDGICKIVHYLAVEFPFMTVDITRASPLSTFFGVIDSVFVPLSWSYSGSYTDIATSVLFMAGLVRLARNARSGNLDGTVLFWLSILTAGISLTSKVIFISRYYLPLVPPVCLTASYGLSGLTGAMSRRLSLLITSLVLFSHALNTLSFYPEFYLRSWPNPGDFPTSFGTLQLSVTRPLGICSAILSALAFMTIVLMRYEVRNKVQAKDRSQGDN